MKERLLQKYMDRTSPKKLALYIEFLSCIQDLLDHPAVREMDEFRHHGAISTLQHCKIVAYYNFIICKKLGLDARSAARGGMLHDFFLYDWHEQAEPKGHHAFEHPRIALANARMYFELNEVEEDIIRTHMWPITTCPPRYPESICICFTDKYCACLEKFGAYHRLELRRHRKLEYATDITEG